jgi:CheY-like chemotaxis protein
MSPLNRLQPIRSEGHARINPAARQTPKVLVVDADSDARELYRNLLLGDGVQVFEAADGRDGLVQALAERPNVALLDARLPYIDGLALCALLHSDPLTQSTRVVLLTADPSPEHVRRCQQRGADVVLVKPVAVEALASLVRDFTGGGPSSQEQPHSARPISQLPVATHGVAKTRSHERYVSTSPPQTPPHLRCPHCDSILQYERSHVGGVSERHPEQWDYFACVKHGEFQYRHRTRKLRPA